MNLHALKYNYFTHWAFKKETVLNCNYVHGSRREVIYNYDFSQIYYFIL